MNRKGFTLVELIAMMAVLAILMVITVPNMSGILNKNKDSITKEDVNKMVSGAKTKFQTKEAKYPKSAGDCVILSLGFIDGNNDINKGINDGVYSKTKSFVVVSKENEGGNTYSYKYYIRLVEELEKDNYQYGLGIISYDEFTAKPSEFMADARKRTTKYEEKDLSTVAADQDSLRNFIKNDPPAERPDDAFNPIDKCTGDITVYNQ